MEHLFFKIIKNSVAGGMLTLTRFGYNNHNSVEAVHTFQTPTEDKYLVVVLHNDKNKDIIIKGVSRLTDLELVDTTDSLMLAHQAARERKEGTKFKLHFDRATYV